MIDSPAVPGTPAVYETQCVTDPNYVPEPVSETVVEAPKPMLGSVPPCILNGTCPCFGQIGESLKACIIQNYPGGEMCNLVPVQTCFGNVKGCTPEAPKCEAEVLGAVAQSIPSLIQQLINQLNSLISLLR